MSTVIKLGKVIGSAQGVTPSEFNLEDVSLAARQVLARAEREAAQVTARAKQEAEQIRQQAKTAGKAEAVQAAEQLLRAEQDAKLATVMPALRQAAEKILLDRDAWLKHWEVSAVRLAGAIAARVIRRELRHDPELPLPLVREALELATGATRVQLRMNPTDFETLGAQVKQIAASVAGLSEANVVADEHVTRGGCVVATDFGAIDQQIEAQLARIEMELNDE